MEEIPLQVQSRWVWAVGVYSGKSKASDSIKIQPEHEWSFGFCILCTVLWPEFGAKHNCSSVRCARTLKGVLTAKMPEMTAVPTCPPCLIAVFDLRTAKMFRHGASKSSS